jgi:hypoxanthine phosphoribosyltransferase
MAYEDVQPIITAEEIQRRVAEIGRQITADFDGRELTLVGILKGSVPFIADLMRAIDLPLSCDYIEISTYAGGVRQSGVVRFNKDLSHPIEGRHVLLVEDVVDSGLTLDYIRRNLQTRRPESLSICALLDKHDAREAEVPLDYVGFVIPDRYVVGYGLDYHEEYRNLPFVGVGSFERDRA